MRFDELRRRIVRQRSFLAVFALFAMNGAMWPSIAIRIPEIAARDHLTATLLGLALLGQAVGLAAGMALMPWPIRRWGPRRVGTVGAVAYAAATALPGFAAGAFWLFGALLVFGLANAPLDATLNVVALGLPKPRRGDVMTRLELGFSAGMLAGAGAGAWLATRVSVPVHLTTVAALGVLLALIPARFLPKAVDEETLARRWRPHIARHRRRPRPAHSRREIRPVRRLDALRHRIGYRRRLAALAVVAMAGLWLEGVVPGWSGVYLHTEFGLGPGQNGTGTLVFYVALALAQLLASLLLPAHLRYLAVLAGGLVFAGGMALAVTTRSVPFVLIGMAACGAGAANLQPLAAGVAGDLFGNDGGVVSRVQTPAYLGLAAENPTTGFLAGAFGLQWALALSVPIALVVCLLTPALKTKKDAGHDGAARDGDADSASQ